MIKRQKINLGGPESVPVSRLQQLSRALLFKLWDFFYCHELYTLNRVCSLWRNERIPFLNVTKYLVFDHVRKFRFHHMTGMSAQLYVQILRDYTDHARQLQLVDLPDSGFWSESKMIEQIQQGLRKLGMIRFSLLKSFICRGGTEFGSLFTTKSYQRTQEYVDFDATSLARLELPKFAFAEIDFLKSFDFVNLTRLAALSSSGFNRITGAELKHWPKLTDLDIHQSLLDRQEIVDLVSFLPCLDKVHVKVRAYDVATVMTHFGHCSSLVICQGVKHDDNDSLEYRSSINRNIELPFHKLSDKCRELFVYSEWMNDIPVILTGVTPKDAKSCQLQHLKISGTDGFINDHKQYLGGKLQDFITQDLVLVCPNLKSLTIVRCGHVPICRSDDRWPYESNQSGEFFTKYGARFPRLKHIDISKTTELV